MKKLCVILSVVVLVAAVLAGVFYVRTGNPVSVSYTQLDVYKRQYQGCCRFQPCYHGSEPGCAVIQAAREGKISPARLERYHELLEKTRQLWRARYD